MVHGFSFVQNYRLQNDNSGVMLIVTDDALDFSGYMYPEKLYQSVIMDADFWVDFVNEDCLPFALCMM